MFDLFMAGTILAAEGFTARASTISGCWVYCISVHMGGGARSCR